MGWGSYQEDNQDARSESLRRFSRQQTKKTEKEPAVSKSKKSRRTELMESQFKLRRSADPTRVNRVTRRKKKSRPQKSQRTQRKISRQTQPKQSQRLTPDDIQQYLLERKGRPFLTISDWTIDVNAYFEGSNHVLSLPEQEPLRRFVRLALNYLKRSRDTEEDLEGRWKII